jgi:hypothetical protein
MSTEGAPAARERKVPTSTIAPAGRTGAAAVRVVVAVRFPGLPQVGDLEFDAAWPAEAMRRWLSLARLVLNAEGPVCAPPPPAPPPAPAPAAAPPPRGAPAGPPADELRRWRQRAGLSQAQVAAASGISRSTVSLLEGGRRGAPAGGASRARLTRTLARLAPATGAGGGGAPVEGDR